MKLQKLLLLICLITGKIYAQAIPAQEQKKEKAVVYVLRPDDLFRNVSGNTELEIIDKKISIVEKTLRDDIKIDDAKENKRISDQLTALKNQLLVRKNEILVKEKTNN